MGQFLFEDFVGQIIVLAVEELVLPGDVSVGDVDWLREVLEYLKQVLFLFLGHFIVVHLEFESVVGSVIHKGYKDEVILQDLLVGDLFHQSKLMVPKP